MQGESLYTRDAVINMLVEAVPNGYEYIGDIDVMFAKMIGRSSKRSDPDYVRAYSGDVRRQHRFYHRHGNIRPNRKREILLASNYYEPVPGLWAKKSEPRRPTIPNLDLI